MKSHQTASETVFLATRDEPAPGQRAWMMEATMKDGRVQTVTTDLLQHRASAGQFVMNALKALGPADVETYSVWVVM